MRAVAVSAPATQSAEMRYSDQASYNYDNRGFNDRPYNDTNAYVQNQSSNYESSNDHSYNNHGYSNNRQQPIIITPAPIGHPYRREEEQPKKQENRGILKTTSVYGNKNIESDRESIDTEQTKRPSSSANKPIPPPKPPKPSGDRASQQVPPEALRSQLPWSYTSNRDDVDVRKTFPAIKDDEELPPVPVPDYTLHFKKDKRPTYNTEGI